jgi:hypothetical protein
MGRVGSPSRVCAAAVASLAFVAAGLASASALPTGWRLLDAHIVKGRYPLAMTSAYPLNHPGPIAVRIIGPRGKRLLVSWSANCRKGVTSETNRGTGKGTSSAMVVMRFPFAHPDYCMVAGAGRLNGLPAITPNSRAVRLQIQLLARQAS